MSCVIRGLFEWVKEKQMCKSFTFHVIMRVVLFHYDTEVLCFFGSLSCYHTIFCSKKRFKETTKVFFWWLILGMTTVKCLSVVCVSHSEKRSMVTWSILPVVIRSSQRLSHACLSISNYTAKLRMAHYISYSLFDSPLLLG